jgi:predicted phosphodiesterase
MADLVLVHISDLHFGRLGANDLDARGNEFPFTPQGILGHTHRACVRLEQFYTDIQQKEANVLLIMTGDLTRCGHANEFQVGVDFMGSRSDFGNSDLYRIGLSARAWKASSISGNHDQWCGHWTIPLGGPTPNFQTTFRSMPYEERLKLPDGRTLRLLGVDTDADVHPYGCKRLRAQGHFESQLKALSNSLNDNKGDEVRALLLHHSTSCPHGKRLNIVPDSLKALEDFIQHCDISVLLSGHLHTPEVKVSSYGGGRDTLEARCGTTTQMVKLPWHARLSEDYSRNSPAQHSNTLLLHRISLNTSGLTWNTTTYVRTPRRFIPYYELNPAPEGNFEEEIQV